MTLNTYRWANLGGLTCLGLRFVYMHVFQGSPLQQNKSQKSTDRTPLVAQWLRIHLPMQGSQVRALGQEDPTCRGATKPVRHNSWACTLEPASHSYWAHVPQLLKPACLEHVFHSKRSHHNEKPTHTATKSSPRSPQLEKARVQQQWPNTAKKEKKRKEKQWLSHWYEQIIFLSQQ